jgi:hypothetical protein
MRVFMFVLDCLDFFRSDQGFSLLWHYLLRATLSPGTCDQTCWLAKARKTHLSLSTTFQTNLLPGVE